MNWTGGNLQRFSNKGKGKGGALTKIQKEHFAKQRLRLQDVPKALSPFKFGPFGFRDSLTDQTKEPVNPQQINSTDTGARREDRSGQTRLEDFNSTAGVANRLANMRPRPSEEVRKRKRSRRDSKEQGRTSPHQGYGHPDRRHSSPSRNLSRENIAKAPVLTKAYKTNRDTLPSQRDSPIDTTDSSKPTFSFLGKTNWVGLVTTKPVKISFTSANERDRIGKRRKITKEDLARKQAPARPAYEPSLDDRLVKDKGWRHDHRNSLLDDISIRIGKSGNTSQDSIVPDRHHTQIPETRVSSESMLLDNDRASLRVLTPTHIADGLVRTPRRPPIQHYTSSISAFARGNATTSPQGTTSNNVDTPSLPPLRKALQIPSSNKVVSKFRLWEEQGRLLRPKTPVNLSSEGEERGFAFGPPTTKQRGNIALSLPQASKILPPIPSYSKSESIPLVFVQDLRDVPEEYTSSWMGFRNVSRPSNDPNDIELVSLAQVYDVEDEDREHPDGGYRGTDVESSSNEYESEFESLYAASETLHPNRRRQTEEIDHHQFSKPSGIGNGSNLLHHISGDRLLDSLLKGAVEGAPLQEEKAAVIAAEDEPWMRFILGRDFDETFERADAKFNVPGKKDNPNDISIGGHDFKNIRTPMALDQQQTRKSDDGSFHRSRSHNSSLLTEPNRGYSQMPGRRQIDLPLEAGGSLCSNESLRGSDIPSPSRPPTRRGPLSIQSMERNGDASQESFPNYPFQTQNETGRQHLLRNPSARADSLSVAVGLSVRDMLNGSSEQTPPFSMMNNAANTTWMETTSPDPLAISSPNQRRSRQARFGNLHTGNTRKIIFSRPQPFMGKLAAPNQQTVEELVNIGRNTMKAGNKRRRTGNAAQSKSGFKVPPRISALFPDDGDDIESISDFM